MMKLVTLSLIAAAALADSASAASLLSLKCTPKAQNPEYNEYIDGWVESIWIHQAESGKATLEIWARESQFTHDLPILAQRIEFSSFDVKGPTPANPTIYYTGEADRGYTGVSLQKKGAGASISGRITLVEEFAFEVTCTPST